MATAALGSIEPINAGSDDTDMLARLAERHSIPDAVPADNTPSSETLAGDPPAVVVPDEKPPGDVVPPAAPAADSAARRVSEKAAAKAEKEELAALKLKIADLEAKAAKLPELETKNVEYKTLAEQRAAELEIHNKRFKNEQDEFDPKLIFELPAVKEAQQKYNAVADKLFPATISNPLADEPERRFDFNRLEPAKAGQVKSMLDHWEKEEFEGKGSPEMRDQIQHVLLSNIAAAMGVKEDHFTPIEINGQPFNAIRPSHPVYQHLSAQIRPFINARRERAEAEAQARSSKVESMKTVVGTRVSNSRKMMTDSGVGVTGEDLKAALAKTPDHPILNAMASLESDPELLEELKANMEIEAGVNGYFRPQLDLTESDPQAYDTAARAHMTRIGQRAVYAPLTPVLLKHTRKQAETIKTLNAKIAALEAEANSTLKQAEPGAVSGGAEGKPAEVIDGLSEYERRVAARHNLI